MLTYLGRNTPVRICTSSLSGKCHYFAALMQCDTEI